MKLLDKMHKYKTVSYCLKCNKNTKCIKTRVWKTSNNKRMLLSKCAISVIKKLRFINEQEGSKL